MKNNNCITAAEWVDFFSATGKDFCNEFIELSARINAHIGHCEACRTFYENYVRAEDAMEEWIAAKAEEEDSAYLAVASDEYEEDDGVLGQILVNLDMKNGQGCFKTDSLELSGDCLRYSFRSQDNGSRLVHAGNTGSRICAANGKVIVSLPEYCNSCSTIDLISNSSSKVFSAEFSEEGIAEIPVNEDDTYTLQIMILF